MKKTYIEPKNTVVKLNTTHTLLVQSQVEVSENDYDGVKEIESRKTISAPDAWEEW